MAPIRGWLGAEQAGRMVASQQRAPGGSGLALDEQGAVGGSIGVPIAAGAITIEQRVGRREGFDVLIGDSKALAQQERQVIALGPARELRGIAQARIDQRIHAGAAQQRDKFSERELGEADCVDGGYSLLHVLVCMCIVAYRNGEVWVASEWIRKDVGTDGFLVPEIASRTFYNCFPSCYALGDEPCNRASDIMYILMCAAVMSF